jgi:hypothetical protein
MVLTRSEKEELVIQLYEEGKTIREIAKEVHMSFGPIGNIIQKKQVKPAMITIANMQNQRKLKL